LLVVVCIELGGRDIAKWPHQPMMIEPRDPFQSGQLDGLLGLPGAASVDDFGLVKPLMVSARALS
jgi:hypothetical protein